MKYTIMLFLLFISFIFLGCEESKKITQPGPITELELFGKWHYHEVDPYSNDTMDWYLTFNNDFTFIDDTYVNGSLVFSDNGTFRYTDITITFIYPEGFFFTLFYTISGDILTLTNGTGDGERIVFSKQ